MKSAKDSGEEFLKRLTDIVIENLTNPQFGVSMLASKMGMSRANLHRKVNTIAKISVSQFILQERLKKARTILRTSSVTVSEVAYEVGFNNVSYFIKCFHRYYGYSPGEVGQREADEGHPGSQIYIRKNRLRKILITGFSAAVLAFTLLILFKPGIFKRNMPEPIVAMLPPYYEPQDSAYCKPVNGCVQNIIDNLNSIRDITCRPWLSVLQFINSDAPPPEIATKLKVNYVVKPSILTGNGKVKLNIDIIEGKKNISIWTHAYDLDTSDLTTLYPEITKDIAMKINAEITPEEKYKIERPITSNGKALNYYNEGVDYINSFYLNRARNNIDSAIIRFENALKFDSTCASAYAQLARWHFIFYYPDFQSGREPTKSHSEQIYELAEKASIYGPELELTFLAKFFYNWFIRDYDLAIHWASKALKYNPKSDAVAYYLCNLYSEKGEVEKTLETGFNFINSGLLLIDDTVDVRLGHIYKMMASVYQQLGFYEQAMEYVDKVIATNPELPDGINTKTRIMSSLRGEYRQSINLLLKSVDEGITNSMTYYQLGLYYYLLRDYSNAAIYNKKLLEHRGQGKLDRSLISYAACHIATVLLKTGETEKAQRLMNEEFENPYFQDPRLRSRWLIGYYAFQGDTANAMDQMRIFLNFKGKEDRAMIRWFKDAPVYDTLQNIPEYKELVSELEGRFWDKHERAKKTLQEKGLL